MISVQSKHVYRDTSIYSSSTEQFLLAVQIADILFWQTCLECWWWCWHHGLWGCNIVTVVTRTAAAGVLVLVWSCGHNDPWSPPDWWPGLCIVTSGHIQQTQIFLALLFVPLSVFKSTRSAPSDWLIDQKVCVGKQAGLGVALWWRSSYNGDSHWAELDNIHCYHTWLAGLLSDKFWNWP